MKSNSTILLPINVVLPNSRSNIDEKDLYKHATEKKNNQSERAYVYINQRYNKMPVRNKFIKTLAQPGFAYALATIPATLPAPAVQTPCPSTFDATPNFNSKFQGVNLEDKKNQQQMSSYFVAPDMFRCKFNDEPKSKDSAEAQIQVPPSQGADERRDYLELLKSPLLRSVNQKVIHENIRDPSSISSSNIPYRENYIKKYNFKNQYKAMSQDEVVRKNGIRTNYGFNSVFIKQPDYQPKELTSRVEDAYFENESVNDDTFQINFENNQEEDKLLDKYLKDTLADIPLINDNDKVRTSPPECTLEDCVLESRTKSLKNRSLLTKPDCQCERIPSDKQANPFILKSKSLKQGSNRNNSPTKSSEQVFYEEMISEDSNMLKQDDDVVRPLNRVSFTPLQ